MSDYFELTDARPVKTPSYLLARQAIKDAAEEGAIALIYGEAGTGKSFAARHAVAAVRSRLEIECIEWTAPHQARKEDVVKALLKQVTGRPFEGTRFPLTERLEDELAQSKRLIWVEEAQNLNKSCMQVLRGVWDEPKTEFGFVFSGGHGCFDVLASDRMLMSRIARRCRFAPMKTDEVIEAIPEWHPLWRGRAKLVRVADGRCRGNWRKWSLLTSTCLSIMERRRESELNEDIIWAALAVIEGGDPGELL